jgi:hypothetical protein
MSWVESIIIAFQDNMLLLNIELAEPKKKKELNVSDE